MAERWRRGSPTNSSCTSVPEEFRDAPGLQGRSEAYTEGFFDGVRSGRHLTATI